MDITFLENIVFWHWWIVAVVLVCIEIFAPAAFFIWCGIAAAIVGIIALVIPGISWQIQFLLFAILSVLSVVGGRMFVKRPGVMDSDQPNLNRRGHQYIDRTFTLDEAIVNGVGRVHVDDSYWRIMGPDLEAGSKVKVTAVDGSTLIVEKAE